MLWAPAVFGGLGVLALGLLVSAVVGPRWGPLGALGTALCFPLLHVNRSTYSEPLALLVLAAGLLVLVAATAAGSGGHARHARAARLRRRGAHRRWGADPRRRAARDGAAAAGGRPADGPPRQRRRRAALGCGAATGGLRCRRRWASSTGTSAASPARSSPSSCSGSCWVSPPRRWCCSPGAGSVCRPGSATGCPRARRWSSCSPGSCSRPGRCGAPSASRRPTPARASSRGSSCGRGCRSTAAAPTPSSRWCGRPGGPGRWRSRSRFVVLAVAAHHLARAWVRGERLPAWTGPYLVGLASVLLTWARPGITPDHPWADRRLFIVLPLVVVCVVMAAAWLTRWSTRRMSPAVLVVASVGTAARCCARGDGDAAARAASGSSSARWRPTRSVCRASRPATWR